MIKPNKFMNTQAFMTWQGEHPQRISNYVWLTMKAPSPPHPAHRGGRSTLWRANPTIEVCGNHTIGAANPLSTAPSHYRCSIPLSSISGTNPINTKLVVTLTNMAEVFNARELGSGSGQRATRRQRSHVGVTERDAVIASPSRSRTSHHQLCFRRIAPLMLSYIPQ